MKTAKTLKYATVFALAIAFIGCVTEEIIPYGTEEMAGKSASLSFLSSGGITIPYRLYVSNGRVKSPLVVFLHGAGERGSDNLKQLSYGISHIAKFVDTYSEDAVILAPQCPEDRYWKSEDIMEALGELVSFVSESGYVDKSRIYVTGYSMGGEGTWIYSLKHPKQVTTIVPLCGGPLRNSPYGYSDVSEDVSGMNVWAFNYFDDPAVDNTYSKTVMSKIWAVNTNSVNYTLMLEGGHTAEMYGSKKLMQWMFGTKRK